MKANFFATQTWSDFERIRSRWEGTFVVKGINDPRDADMAARLGADSIIVSNHGGRQLDAAPTALEILPHIRAAVPSKLKIIVDGGFRRGSDIVIALCLGADFVLTGRATLYGAISGGDSGAERAVTILGDEVFRIISQIGCCTIAQLDPSRVMAVNGVGDLLPVQDVRERTSMARDKETKSASELQMVR
jgi:L-lactate dehydrogenase (cytochrome)/(S)-mandelate dehydrogenase